MNRREQEILELAASLIELQGDSSHKAFIDAQFLFRFEHTWCRWVSRIRTMMRALIGESGDEPFVTEDGVRLLVHLEANSDLQLGITERKLTINTAKGIYRILDQKLRERYDAAIAQAMRDGDTAELERLFQEVWAEANQTVKIRAELDRLAQAYRIIPSKHEARNYAPTVLRRQFRALVDYVVWGKVVPSFLWSETILLESRTDRMVRRTLRPHKWTKNSWETPVPVFLGGTIRTRVRTWAIYYLIRRGGGGLTEQQAVDLWNCTFDDFVDVRNFRADRDRLLKHR